MQCDNCGATFDDSLAECPYCEHMNAPAAEAEYMERLDDIREDMEDLDESMSDAMKSVTTEIMSKALKYLLIAAAVLVGAILVFVALSHLSSLI